MKVIKGHKKLHEFVDEYMKTNENEKFLIIDKMNPDYKYNAKNILRFCSSEEDWENNVKSELMDKDNKEIRFIIFINDTSDNINEYKEFYDENRNDIFIFKDECENIIEEYKCEAEEI